MVVQRLSDRRSRLRRNGVIASLVTAVVAFGLTVPQVLGPLRTSGEAGSAVTAPEHPEGTSFNPNEIKDIKAADPGAGVGLIGPPTANNQGDARLSYPFEVPKGRADLQPRLAVGYNSAGGNGWLGSGWDVTTPVITLDTRWGVPRYHPSLETETYQLDGEELTPVAHRGEPRPRTAEKVFHTRVEGRFDRIVRHGDGPRNYWWEVTDKAGTRMAFGGADNTTLTDAAGNVATWALREVRDTNDNFMRYTHVRVADGGVANSTVPGVNLYPRRITYTGHGSTEGKYSVTFIRDRERGEPRRADVSIDARYGFKKVTADLLRRVEVKLEDQLVRAYELNYRSGAFAKTLLASVSQFGEDNRLFTTHAFDYFDDVRDQSGGYNAFAAAVNWHVADDDLGVDIREGEASALSATTSAGVGGHLYVGYNPVAPVKSGSVGVKVGANAGVADGLLALADVNGDGLPDKVFRKGGSVFYRPNLSGPGGQPKFGDTAIRLPDLPGISAEKTLSGSIGIEGYAGVAAQLDFVSTTTISDRYFADVNADGITDLVNNGSVLFGRLDANGQPAYGANSLDTPVPVGAGAVSGTIVGDQTAEFQRQVDNSPLLDGVRRWVAPFDGTVRVDGRVRLVADNGPERAAYTKADGVRVAIQHKDTELWAQRIGPRDYLEFAPTGVDSIAVRKGDAVYFRVQSILDGKYDEVAWDPRISYLGVPAGTDVNGLDNSTYQASRDFTLGGRPSLVTAPLTGTLRLTGDVGKGATSDDVTVVIAREGTDFQGNPTSTDVFRKVLPAASAGTTPIDLGVPVSRGEKLSWRLRVDSPIDAGAVRWVPKAHYTAAQGVDSVVDSAGHPTIVVNPPYDLDLYPVNTLTAPQQSYKVTRTGTLTAQPNIKMNFNTDSREIVFTVKKRGGQVLAKRVIGIKFGVGVPPEFTRVTTPVTAGDELFFDLSTLDSKMPGVLTEQSVKVSYDGSTWTPVPSALHAPAAPSGAFAQPYRGWGAIGYQANKDRATRPIAQAELVLDQSFRDSLPAQPREADVPGFTANPRVDAPRITVLVPLPAKGRWAGSDENTWVSGGGTSSSRLGLDTIDVLADSDIAGARGVPRRGRTQQISATLAAGPFGGTAMVGTTVGEVDFLDLNGDKFPDVVGSREIQYSDMVGGLGSTRGTLGGNVRETDSLAGNVSANAGSPARTVGTARGTDTPSGDGSANTSRTGAEMPSLGIGGSLGGGESDAKVDLIDINGDDLPDKVYANGDAALNLGYGFAAREPWPGGPVNDAQTRNAGVNLGFNLDSYGFAGGLSATLGSSKTNATLTDVNGDGLTDRVFTDGANPIKVAINTGSGFGPKVPFRGGFADIAADENANLGGGAYFTFGFCSPGAGCVVFNPGVDTSIGIGRAKVALRDIDGDGLADHVKSGRDDELVYAANRTGRTNLLKSVSRPMGARIDLDYTRTGNTYDQPESKWVLARTAVHDGHPGDGVDTRLTTFRYERGRHDRLEREFRGFGKVVTEVRDPGTGDAVYRGTTEEFRTDSSYTRGLVSRTLTADGAGRPFNETVNTYRLRDVDTGGDANPAATTATVHPQLVKVEKRFYEGAATAGKSTHVENSYDDHGNLTRSFDAADEGADDDVEATFTYTASNPACRERNIVGTADSVRETGSGILLRHRQAAVDCASGEVRQVREYLADGTAATTDLDYYADGNLRKVTGPVDKTGRRYELEYGYDTVVGVHVESTVDSFGLRSTATHDLKYGLPDRTVDQNGRQLLRSYDSVGRLEAVTGPYEIGSGRPTIAMEYHPEAPVPYAVTRNTDRTATGVRADTIDTVSFTDGFKAVVQTKKDAAVATTPGAAPADVMIVSGRTKVDFLGRVTEKYHPVTEPKGAASTTFNPAFDAVPPTRDTFDVLDRTVSSVLPDNTSTSAAYGFGPDRGGVTRFEKTATDANGKQRRTYTDVRELPTAVKEFNAASGQPVLWTSYEYNPVRQITAVVDDKDNATRSSYDNLGRRTVFDSPDSGRTETRYDLAGNLVAKVTANLRQADRAVEYDYDYNRLKGVRYPTFPANDVSYTYGAPGAADNTAGRISEVRDAAGTVTRGYGLLGEIARETRTVTPPGKPTKAFTTTWAYDAFNRVLRLTYPDGEVLTYDYDSAGQVDRASGVKNGTGTTYLARLDYDKFGQKLFQETGTGVRTAYTYDPADRQLANLKSRLADGSAFQDITYTRDRVGNITKLANAAPASSAVGGPSTQAFGYDELYRLTSASGEYTGKDAKPNRYSLTMSYDSIHNATTKTQRHTITGPAGTASPSPFTLSSYDRGTPSGPVETPDDDPAAHADVQDKTSYDYTYSYQGERPHAPSRVGPITQDHDDNGNLTDSVNTGTSPSKRRQFVWDEENRLACNEDGAVATVAQAPASCAGATVRYLYDAKGERVVKQGDGLSLYPSGNYSERDGTGYKHVFVGDTRLATKTVEADGAAGTDASYFHADHVGSAGYVTDGQGRLVEHLEYFPFGETWVQERAGSSGGSPPYRFTGKELDEETGLYYHGARYYNPRTQLWTSPDPALPDYFDTKTAGGVHEPRNLAAYTYVHNDPVKLVDPTGKWPKLKMPSKDTWKKIGHTTLDVAGMVPVVGEAADLANAGWYTAEGDYTNAALSAASAIPGAGYAANAAKYGKHAVDAAKAADKAGDAVRAVDKTADTAKAVPAPAKADATSCARHSFPGATPVVMADGTRKRIDEVEVGQAVLATDPATGETVAREVTTTWAHDDEPERTEVTLDVDGERGTATSTLTATDWHPVWVPEAKAWVPIGDLRVGSWLRTSTGTWVQAVAVRHFTAPDQVHDLTVDGLHTYYVTAGPADVLVHNCGNDQGVYVFQDRTDPAGRPYVGESDNLTRRLDTEHVGTGKRLPGDPVVCVHVCGGKNELHGAEAGLMDSLGGKANLSNKRNSPGHNPKRAQYYQP